MITESQRSKDAEVKFSGEIRAVSGIVNALEQYSLESFFNHFHNLSLSLDERRRNTLKNMSVIYR